MTYVATGGCKFSFSNSILGSGAAIMSSGGVELGRRPFFLCPGINDGSIVMNSHLKNCDSCKPDGQIKVLR